MEKMIQFPHYNLKNESDTNIILKIGARARSQQSNNREAQKVTPAASQRLRTERKQQSLQKLISWKIHYLRLHPK